MEQKIITFTANEQGLVKTGGISHYASDTISYIKAVFTLGENWQGFDEVRAVFKSSYVCKNAVLNSVGECYVPFEALMYKGDVRVNLVGSIYTGEEIVDRLTTYSVKALTIDEDVPVCGEESQPISPSEYEQFVAKVANDANRAEQSATASANSADEAEASAQNASESASASAVSASDSARSATASAQSAQNASESAITAENAKDDAEDARDKILGMRATAETLEAGSDATASYSDGLLTLGIPRGDKGEQGIQGETGATPNLTIGTVETLEPTEDATATITGTAENPVLNLGIPKGDTGEVSFEDLEALLPTDTASGDIVTITDGQSVVPAKSLKVQLEPIQEGSGTPSPDNVRPISGHTECVTEVCGKNLLNPTLYSGSQYNPSVGTRWTLTESAEQFENPSEGVFTLLCPTTWMQRVLVFEMPDDEADYYLRLARSSTRNCGTILGWLDADYTVLTATNYTSASYEHSFALANRPSGAKYYYITLTNRDTANAILTVTNPQIELGSTATAYEPYQGDTYTTPLGRTVYGGTLDVVSGELVVDRAIHTFDGTETFGVDVLSEYSQVSWASFFSIGKARSTFVSNRFVQPSDNVGGLGLIWNSSVPRMFMGLPTSVTNNAEARAWLIEHPTTVVYELAEPQTYQLTPQEIRLLLGTNNIWSDGNVTIVYNADIQKWVEKKLNGNSTTLTMSRPMTAELNETETETAEETEETETADAEAETETTEETE